MSETGGNMKQLFPAVPLKENECVLFMHRDEQGNIVSLTVFRIYSPTPPPDASPEWYAAKWDSAFGPVDITYSYGSTYKTLIRKRSGFYTGKALKGECWRIFQTRKEAMQRAEEIRTIMLKLQDFQKVLNEAMP